jgi:hypothetical protein
MTLAPGRATAGSTLSPGCDIIISDRGTDDAAILAPLVHEFGWAWDDWDKLAVGITAGHLIECGANPDIFGRVAVIP